jgi:hypothetical protein
MCVCVCVCDRHPLQAFVHLCVSSDEVDAGVYTEEELLAIAKLRGTLHLNRALANIKLEDWKEAMWDCNEVRDICCGARCRGELPCCG